MTLLIVDDEILAIQGLMDDIPWTMLDFDVILTANSYAQAVNLFMSHMVDVLLCDIEMPFGNGITLVKWVREHYPQTQCIFLTCHDSFRYAKEAVNLQCIGYILKPAETQEVTGYLKKAQERLAEHNESRKNHDYRQQYLKQLKENMKPSGSKDAVRQVEDYIHNHISEPLKVEELAGMVYLSVTHLGRLFKKKHNLTLIDYIAAERINLARELLADQELTISAVAAACGFNNYSYFTKTFKKIAGKTPREYRLADDCQDL